MLRVLLKDKIGNFSIVTAAILPLLLGFAGMSVDFTSAAMARNNLQNAADAAAVGAVAERSPAVLEAMTMAADGDVDLGKTDALKLFHGQIKSTEGVQIVSVSAKIVKTGNNLKAVITYVARIPTSILQVIGKSYIEVSGTAEAAYDTQIFRDFYLLLDNTPSMGVAATPADVDKMVQKTSDKCAFACHINNDGVENSSDYYHLAKKLGVTIRIDVVAKATAALMDTATNQRNTSDQYRMAIYTFGQKAEDTKLLEVSPLSMDLSQAKTKASAIELMTIPKQGYNNDQQTSFDTALTQIMDKMGKPGNGSSTASPEKVLFFVTDGVGDSYKPSTCTKKTTNGRCQEPIDLKYCKALKDANYKIAVLYTTYLPLPTNDWYNTWISPFQSQIGTNLKSCATDGLFFEVSPTQGISEAMSALFLKIVNMPRLTG